MPHLLKRQNVLILNQFTGCHSPSPPVVVSSDYGSYGNFEVSKPIGNQNCWLKIHGAKCSRDDVSVGITEIGVCGTDTHHPGRAQDVVTQEPRQLCLCTRDKRTSALNVLGKVLLGCL